MAEPVYRTKENTKEINKLRDRVKRRLGCRWEQTFDKRTKEARLINTVFLDKDTSVDRTLFLADCRCRGSNWSPARFDDLEIGANTWAEIQAAQVKWPTTEFYVIFGLANGLGDNWIRYHQSLDKFVSVRMGGNKGRKPEPMAHLPWRFFRPVGTPCQIPYV